MIFDVFFKANNQTIMFDLIINYVKFSHIERYKQDTEASGQLDRMSSAMAGGGGGRRCTRDDFIYILFFIRETPDYKL